MIDSNEQDSWKIYYVDEEKNGGNCAICKKVTGTTKMLLYSVDKPNRTFSEGYLICSHI